MNLNQISQLPTALLYILFIWSLIWKGLALWNAARQNQRNWFILLLVVNTAGILDIVFLFFFAKKKLTLQELLFWQKSKK